MHTRTHTRTHAHTHAHTHTHTHTHTPSNRLFLIVKLYYAYAIFASYTIQFYVPMDFLEPPLYDKLRLDYFVYRFPRFHSKIILLIRLAFRTTVVVITG